MKMKKNCGPPSPDLVAEYDRRLVEAGKAAMRSMPNTMLAAKLEYMMQRPAYRDFGPKVLSPWLTDEILRRLRGL